MDNVILNKLDSISRMLREQNLLKKEVLTFSEATDYLSVSSSHLYKLTSGNIIPFYKPNNKKIFFKRSELDAWLTSNRVEPNSEIEDKANAYLIRKGKVDF
jgi:excisionase family DNA binding protein